MFDFAQLAETGQKVAEFINMATARLTAMETKIDAALEEIRAHRGAVEPQIANLELAHKEIMGWIADIEGAEIVEAATTVEAAVVEAQIAASTATAAAVEAAAVVEEAHAEVTPSEKPPVSSEVPPAAEPPGLEETPIPPETVEPPKERKRHFLSL